MIIRVSPLSKTNIGTKFLLSLLFLACPFPAQALSQTKPISIQASIGQPSSLTIYGYTSPLSKTELTAPNVYAQTYSKSDGYFEFDRVYLPESPQDLCLSSLDSNRLTSPPICIPAPNTIITGKKIGPILLAPTISLNNPNPKPGDSVQIQGESIPNTKLILKLFQQNKNPLQFPTISWAYELPEINFNTDTKGRYGINLPSIYSTSYRLNTQALYQTDQASPQSFTLTYTLPAYWLIILKQFLKPILSFILSLCTLIIFIFLNSKKNKYLPYLYDKKIIKVINEK